MDYAKVLDTEAFEGLRVEVASMIETASAALLGQFTPLETANDIRAAILEAATESPDVDRDTIVEALAGVAAVAIVEAATFLVGPMS